MCNPAFLATLGLGAGATATAAGATAAAGIGSTLQTIAAITSIGGAVIQGVQGYQTAKANANAIAAQRTQQEQINASEDRQTRMQFMQAIRQQTAELAARGIQLDSPTAVLLGETAAEQLSFKSQAVRSQGIAQDTQLANDQAAYRAKATSNLLSGFSSAAGSLLTAAPELWPGLKGS